MDREVRYCTATDGVRIAYCAEGAGPPLVMCPSRGESFSVAHLSPELEAFIQRLGRGRRLIRYDERGTGLSQRQVDDRSSDGFARDIAAVADAAGLDRFSLWASALSGPRAVLYASDHGERVEHLILHGTTVAATGGFTPDAINAFASLARFNWGLWAGTFMDLSSSRKYPELVESLGQMMSESTNGESAADTLLAWAASPDLSPSASTLAMPVLVLHGTEDLLVAPSLAYEMGAAIPNVRVVTLTGGTSLYFLGDNDVFFRAVDEFLPLAQTSTDTPGARQSAGVRTILFTDLVGHTAMMQRLGDVRGREVLREHERITRGVLHQHHGDEIKTMGDGFMASFASVTTAMDCAVTLQRAFAERNAAGGEPLNVRVGLNAGEPIEEDGDLFGATVILAARIAAKADAGEILIPEPVRHLLGGKDFLYADRGTFVPRGFEDAVRLFEVRWQQ